MTNTRTLSSNVDTIQASSLFNIPQHTTSLSSSRHAYLPAQPSQPLCNGCYGILLLKGLMLTCQISEVELQGSFLPSLFLPQGLQLVLQLAGPGRGPTGLLIRRQELLVGLEYHPLKVKELQLGGWLKGEPMMTKKVGEVVPYVLERSKRRSTPRGLGQ
ncbi:hypothetical protein LIER_16565 [Lithospermum erythrorhizon]|uniref:Uncharacterized protein n=1 Tax=Lithospermum erythrorhizon TaxID=34254 RepID=A0AAV3Q8M7_LITER